MNAHEDVPTLKLVLLGESSVGKTALVHRFTTNKFDSNTTNTIGAAFITKLYHSQLKPERRIKFEIWDTAGQERYRSLTPMYYRNAKVALVCVDLSNFEDSFKTAKFWIEQLEINNSGNNSDNDSNDKLIVRLVGNKSDLFAKLSDEEKSDITFKINQFTDSTGIIYNQTSAFDGTGLTELFDEIVDGIDDKIFIEYYEQKSKTTTENQIGSILDARMNGQSTSSYTCC
ncbi:ras family-domain-containing protein [Scheffersomyces amazonensis]|uniref:ras family-domain-containing protein n=1 Tax=Scheffersomyces amazonensis TaxID=1078765 RepID=UPI00315DECB2